MTRPTRLATIDDISEIVRVINAAYCVEAFFVKGDRTSREDIGRRLATPGASFLVIDGDEPQRLAAAVAIDVFDGHGHFAMLSVDPEAQGRGLSRVLMEAIEMHCRKAGCSALELEVVNLREELPPFYEKFGFAQMGTAPFNSPEKLTREAHLVRMSKPL